MLRKTKEPETDEAEILEDVVIRRKIDSIKKNATKQTLITRSLYDGIWLDSLQCMDGHGIYKFPDGSEYRGYFARGHFHGYGTLHLASPYNFTYRGTFINGLLHEIEDMWFDDGLHVNATFKGWHTNFSKWKYCTHFDRRYSIEQREGLQPVGPFSFLTNSPNTRNLSRQYYDVEEGIYNPCSGLLTHRHPPFNHFDFIACQKDIDWIIHNCRHSPLVKNEIDPKVRQKIISNNLKSEVEIAEHVPSCNYDQDKNRKRYFAKLCKDRFKDKSSVGERDSDVSVCSRYCNSTSTCDSFNTPSIDVDVQEALFLVEEYDHLKLGRNLCEEASVMISEPVAS